jgi:hypothetical protein
MHETRKAYRILIRRLLGKPTILRQKSRWEDNIKMSLWEINGGESG